VARIVDQTAGEEGLAARVAALQERPGLEQLAVRSKALESAPSASSRAVLIVIIAALLFLVANPYGPVCASLPILVMGLILIGLWPELAREARFRVAPVEVHAAGVLASRTEVTSQGAEMRSRRVISLLLADGSRHDLPALSAEGAEEGALGVAWIKAGVLLDFSPLDTEDET